MVWFRFFVRLALARLYCLPCGVEGNGATPVGGAGCLIRVGCSALCFAAVGEAAYPSVGGAFGQAAGGKAGEPSEDGAHAQSGDGGELVGGARGAYRQGVEQQQVLDGQSVVVPGPLGFHLGLALPGGLRVRGGRGLGVQAEQFDGLGGVGDEGCCAFADESVAAGGVGGEDRPGDGAYLAAHFRRVVCGAQCP